jgi:hypothetical protein
MEIVRVSGRMGTLDRGEWRWTIDGNETFCEHMAVRDMPVEILSFAFVKPSQSKQRRFSLSSCIHDSLRSTKTVQNQACSFISDKMGPAVAHSRLKSYSTCDWVLLDRPSD